MPKKQDKKVNLKALRKQPDVWDALEQQDLHDPVHVPTDFRSGLNDSLSTRYGFDR